MTAMYDFDDVLGSALQADGPQAMPPAVAEAALGRARDLGQRRPLVRALDARAWPAPAFSPANRHVARAASVGLVLLLILAGVAAFVAAGRLFERRTNVFGVFERAGDFPAFTADRGDRYVATAAVLTDGRVLVTGMYSSGEPTATWAMVYDPAAGTWSETGREPESRKTATATTLPDGRVLIVGGWWMDTDGTQVLPSVAELYDPATGTFLPTTGGLATPRYDHTATLLADGRVLITGGSVTDRDGTQAATASAEIFDPATGRFSRTGSMTESRQTHAATRLSDGRVLVTGGTTHDMLATATADIYDPATGSFTRVGPMRDARADHASTTLADGRVLVVGGSNPNDRRPLSSAELFDPATGSFVATSPLATERTGLGTLHLPDGRVLVIGGWNAFGNPRTAELFDPATGHFEPAGTSATPHADAWLGALPDGHVVVLGQAEDLSSGAPELWSALEPPALVLDDPAPAGPAFAAVDTESMLLRAGHTATLLADGRILVTGGTDVMATNYESLASAEIFDPKTGRSRRVADMSVARSGHVAVPLPDGRVLIAGGEATVCPEAGRCDSPQVAAEIFDPLTQRFTTLPVKRGPVPARSRGWPAAASLLADSRVLFIGPQRVVTIVDPATGSVQPGPILRGDGLVAPVRLADGRVVILGVAGVGPNLSIFDVASQGEGTIPTARDWDAALALTDGRVLLIRDTGEAALFDPASSTVTPTGPMTTSHDPAPDPSGRFQEPYQRGLTLLSDGRVLVTGGRADDGFELRAEAAADLFDPKTGTFQAIGPMHDARYGHSTTLLPDGRVVIIGGIVPSPDRNVPEPAPIEIFDPSKLH